MQYIYLYMNMYMFILSVYDCNGSLVVCIHSGMYDTLKNECMDTCAILSV